MQTIKDSIKTIITSLVILSLISIVYAWTEPISNPPSSNVSAPINTSSDTQTKSGALGIGGVLSVGGQSVVSTDASNIKIGDLASGDGTRGLILRAGDADRLSINTAGNIGIGTGSPSQKLDVAGYVKGQSGLCIGNDCRASWPASALTGSGFANYISKWTGGSTLGNSQIYDNGANVGVGTTVPQSKLQVNGDIRANNFKFPDGTIAAGPWELKSKTYTLSASDCSGTFTSWKSQGIYLPKYTVDIDFDMPVYSCDPDTGVCSPIPDNQGTWAHLFGYNASGNWTRIGYRGLNCKPYQTDSTRCGWGNQNPGNTYSKPATPSQSYVFLQMVGYCTKYGSDHKTDLVVRYWGPATPSIPNSSYSTPSP